MPLTLTPHPFACPLSLPNTLAQPKTLRDGGGNDVSTDLTDPANDRRNGAPADVALVSVAIKGRARNAALDLADKV